MRICQYNTVTRRKAAKDKVKQGYTMVDESLKASGLASMAEFLNLGYAVNENKQYAVFEPDQFSLNRNSLKLLLEVIGRCDLNNKKVIEIGCGRGGNIAAVNEFFQPQLTVGLDLCSANIQSCQANHKPDNGSFCIGDAEDIPFADHLFDVVLNIESSDSYPDIRQFYGEVHRILKNRGYFLYTDILPVEKFKECEEYLKHIGFSMVRNQDITMNVMLSCYETARRRMSAYEGSEKSENLSLLEDFLAVPGSPIYEEMRRGTQVYKILNLIKS